MARERHKLFYLILPSLPVFLYFLVYVDIITLGAFKVACVICVILFGIVPLIFKYSYGFQRSVVFLTFINVPSSADYEHPEKYGLSGSRNFRITAENVELGTWQILPANLENINETSAEFFERVLSDGQPVVIYNHGNGGCRLTPHRIETYHMLRKFFHVIAFDYRGYGDSSSEPPSEPDVVRDIVNVYKWVRNRTRTNVFIWGHSLGTSLSTNALREIQQLPLEKPLGLILESPFNNMREEIGEFPLAKMFKFLPWFKATIVNPMSENFKFETDRYVCEVNVPVMILHAKDDKVVPYKLGEKLYAGAKQCRSEAQGPVLFHSFDARYKFGHKYISRAEDLPEKINEFLEICLEIKTDKIDHQY
ncbi:lysophosphatidylserine lipase ABHD12-like isoform X2 [Anthonomus grandis grandis]|uniref:lysophosphatidylserine lipase ABHD12-like isoform X2 n=1 Tax=Anthonomus grandis grandis TaxID=2921223 RepID=UPI00216586D8|nr:lysophosphatidylserine lipase ABHD12-like isoform X2 [Anthonomus grandis grandis]